MSNIPLYVILTFYLSIRPPRGHLGSFHWLAFSPFKGPGCLLADLIWLWHLGALRQPCPNSSLLPSLAQKELLHPLSEFHHAAAQWCCYSQGQGAFKCKVHWQIRGLWVKQQLFNLRWWPNQVGAMYFPGLGGAATVSLVGENTGGAWLLLDAASGLLVPTCQTLPARSPWSPPL